ncbi:MAG: Gfo/Idh/MocA family oxidoreductase [Chloroflexi bacterium]|nr:Gfo/Idh/MocA family oxidoreductase [Chloroflexota bacterium]
MIKVVLVGAGFIAESHLKGYLQAANAQVAAVVDVDAGRARRMAAMAGGVPWLTDYREALNMADIVDVCTTSATHVEIGTAAARAGKHVHIEKPFAMTVAECETLLNACEQAGVKVMAGQTERFKPVHEQMKQVIERGDIGKLVMARVNTDAGHFWPGGWQGWQIDPALSGGLFLHLGIHMLDLLLWLFDRPPRSIYAQTIKRASSAMDMNDYYQAIIRFADDSTAIANLTYALPRRGDSVRAAMLVGSHGSAYHNLSDDAYLISDTGLHFVDDGLDPPIARQVAHFVDCVEQGRDPMVTPAQIRTALRTALAADESSRTGRVVEI